MKKTRTFQRKKFAHMLKIVLKRSGNSLFIINLSHLQSLLSPSSNFKSTDSPKSGCSNKQKYTKINRVLIHKTYTLFIYDKVVSQRGKLCYESQQLQFTVINWLEYERNYQGHSHKYCPMVFLSPKAVRLSCVFKY